MKSIPMIALQAGRDRRIRAGHPWAYSNEIAMTGPTKALPAGTLVALNDAEGRRIGRAMFNPHSLIAARLMDRETEAETNFPIDEAYFRTRFEAALALRDRLVDGPYYRLAHGEADRLPGLIVDRYNDVLTVQMNAAGLELLREPILAALISLLRPRAILLRNDGGSRALEGLEEIVEVAHGELSGPIELKENGSRFLCDPIEGQKTGWFYDQRDNRAAVARFAPGADVLDAYCYAGGFGVQAAVAGARRVTFLDRSKPALELAEQAAGLNRVADRCEAIPGEVFHNLQQLFDAGRKFDIVIADPPAFVKNRKDLTVGARGYRKMTRLGAQLVKPGGFLFVASCSHHLDPEGFAEEVRAGLARAQRSGRILRTAGAAADHPVHPFLPESAYLKATLLQLD